jgi:hypothetical protein
MAGSGRRLDTLFQLPRKAGNIDDVAIERMKSWLAVSYRPRVQAVLAAAEGTPGHATAMRSC